MEKHKDRIFQEAAVVRPDQKRNKNSPYHEVELALVYWFREMRSRPVPPPLSGCVLKVKAKQYITSLQFIFCLQLKINTY